jgi:upstream activation factor subunit UAF30
MAEPTEAELFSVIRKIVAKVDLEMTGIKKFTKLLSHEFGGVNLSHKSKFIKRSLTEVINEDNEEEEDSSSSEEEEVKKAPAKKKKPAAKKGEKKAGGGGGGGLTVVKEISDEMATFLGKGKQMARTEIVKMLWVHIKEHELQNPENKREIILDDDMKAVFGQDVERFTMFTMNKYIGAHIDPYKPVDLTTNTAKPKKRKLTAKEKKEGKKKRKGGGGLQAPYQLSPELARVVGRQILPRPRVVKHLWGYIREHDLQDPADKRTVVCDAKLKVVMGGEAKVTIFSMQKHITPHLLEKLDKSYYTPSDAEPADEETEDEED